MTFFITFQKINAAWQRGKIRCLCFDVKDLLTEAVVKYGGLF